MATTKGHQAIWVLRRDLWTRFRFFFPASTSARAQSDELPAGFVSLGGLFLKAHRDELMSLVRNEKTKAKAEHPMERIVKIEDQDDSALVTTTGIHLARCISQALHRAYKGELKFPGKPAARSLGALNSSFTRDIALMLIADGLGPFLPADVHPDCSSINS